MSHSRICIDARLISGTTGGVEQAIIGLASGLSALTDGDEEYLFLTYEGADEWLRPYIAGPCRLLAGSPPPDALSVQLMSRYPRLRTVWHYAVGPMIGRRSIRVPRSGGTIERAGVDLIHFAIQTAFLTSIPSIYQPHDLQHLHVQRFFTPYERLKREVLYRAFCGRAKMVIAGTRFVARDLEQRYRLTSDKVRIVPYACVLDQYPTPHATDLTAVQQKFDLPDAFLFYPAYSWPHKNHIGLLEALAYLRDREGTRVEVVLSGGHSEYFDVIQQHIHQLNLSEQVHSVGFVSPVELASLYRLSRGLIFPSKFEGWGLPITEAFVAGVPVACSNVTSLPDLVGDAAYLFDPDDSVQIANAMLRLWTDDALGRQLIESGSRRAALFSPDAVARLLRAHYRRILGATLTSEDVERLTAESPV